MTSYSAIKIIRGILEENAVSFSTAFFLFNPIYPNLLGFSVYSDYFY